ncbi:MAG: hypothetical protein K2L10_00725 [Ruminococcus sp.]|nr:hypothetical protein [Ruminococcus sp.]
MFTKKKIPVTDKTIYMEVYGQNKVAYRVIVGRMGNTVTYGIETEDYISGNVEVIPDFSKNREDAISFVEMLIKNKVPPKYVYIKALDYLCKTI